MRLVKQNTTLPIFNKDFKNDSAPKLRHGVLLPSTIRCLIAGPSNSGKTNIIINLIEDINGLRFENIYVYCKSLHQPKYAYLRKLLKPITGIGFFEFNDKSKIILPSKVKPNSVFVFDDVALEDQHVIREYYCMGRHKNVDCFYTAQSYAQVPKHLIRDNANLICVFPQDRTNMKHIYDDHVNTDMPFNKFIDICTICWKEPYSFLVISKDDNILNGRYRKGFDEFIMI
jgi:hypothetical protein